MCFEEMAAIEFCDAGKQKFRHIGKMSAPRCCIGGIEELGVIDVIRSCAAEFFLRDEMGSPKRLNVFTI